MPPRYRLMILLAAWRSFRFSELTELRRGDIDLSNGKIKISRAVTWVKGKPIVGSPKSDAGIRDVAIPPHLILAVRQHLQDHVLRGKDALLFTIVSGGQIARGRSLSKALGANFTRSAIRSFAREQEVASGIVVGRLQRDKHVGPSQFRDLKKSLKLITDSG
jgi:integrase